VIAEDQLSASLGGGELREGGWLALDGATGEISLRRRQIIVEKPPEYSIVRQWMDAAAKGAA
jgi:pyruvate, orthophosphate dikinase